MDFPSSGGRRLSIDELDTTKLLAHARQQAEERNLDSMLIVDVDAHHDEASSLAEIIAHIDDPVQRQLALSGSSGGRRPLVPRNISYEDGAGRVPRIAFGLNRTEQVPDNTHRSLALSRRAMDAMGVDYACLLPTTVMRLGMQPKKDFEVALATAYNRWLAEVALPEEPRARGMLYLPLYDADVCLETVEQLGDKPGVVGCVVASPRYASVHHNSFARTYAAMEERGLVLAFHGGANWTDRTMALFNKFLSVQAVSGPHFNTVHLTNWLINGMPERFPGLKVMWMESGVAWAVAAMLRLDNEYMMRSFDAPALKRRPSSYMREMFFSTQPLERPEDMGLLESLFRALNAETQLVWGSNFPGPDFDLPSVVADLPFLSDQAKRNILGGTAAKLFRLPAAP